MKEDFQIMYVDDKFKCGDGVAYVIGLINNCAKNKKYRKFGESMDGMEDYREDCWRAEIGINTGDMEDMLSYVGNDGRIHEFCKIDSEFKNCIIKTLNLR